MSRAIVAYGGPARAGDAPGGALYVVDPAFLSYDRVPIRITPTRFEGYENRCDILEVRESEGVYDADMRCTAEGTTSDQTIRMLVQGDNLDLTYVSAGGGKVQLKRCADPQVTVDQPVG